jgi:hypothetical protein
MFSNINLLVIVVLSILFIVLIYFNKTHKKEQFNAYYKDKQKVGTAEMDRGNQPRSTWKSGNLNYESCYKTDTRSGNSIPRKNTFFCDLGNEGEMVPVSGTYSMDFTNYQVYYQKIIKGKRLQGSHTINGVSITFDEFGRPVGQIMTLQQSKETCDNLKNKCVGFIIQSNDNRDKNAATFFVAAVEPGFEDPNTYDRIFATPDERTKEQSSLTSYQNYTSYIKNDVTYVEKAVKELNIPGQQFEKRNCSITNTPEYDLDSVTGILDDCKARCVAMDNCSGFNRTANVSDDKSTTCQLKKVNFDFKITNCPPGYSLDKNSGNCITGWTNQCGQDCAYSKCMSESGTWIPLDYSSNPYTCKPNQSKIVPICNNNQPNLASYSRTGVKGANPNIPDPPKFEAPPQLKKILNRPRGTSLYCPTGNTTFNYPGTLDPTNDKQALAACEACNGKGNCVAVTGDCAGYGYGPNRNYNEYGTIPVFGFQSGCSGGAGRIWKYGYSWEDRYGYVHYGTWGLT